MTLRPDIARAFAHLTSLFDFSALSSQEEVMAAVRTGIERYGDVTSRQPESGITITPVRIGALEAEWITAPAMDADRRILYLHGGGLICGTLSSHRAIAAEMARQSGFSVLNIAYRIAPEHIFPAAHDDAAQAYTWLQDNGPDGARSRACALFILGDSAGGNLAMSVCARAIAQKARLPDRLALLGPCLDNTDNPRRLDRASDPIINRQAVAPMALYAANMPLEDPRISPLYLTDAVLAQFPPVLIQASAAEFLLPDSQILAARLATLGRRNVLSVWPDMPHDWHLFVHHLPEARAALAEAVRFFQN
jgi:acetyl esterase/lipase